jgi:hypothetical protein|tara:strand:+ start:499 stop:711 length:213 start_codon:yes stop_codon:yes gene_type:complete
MNMEMMRLYEIFEEDTSNLLSMARWAMEEHPEDVKEYLGITQDYYVKLLVLVCHLSMHYQQTTENEDGTH